MSALRRILREPLLQFAVIGAAIFALQGWLRGPIAETPERIVVDGARIEQLALGFARVWQRAPSREELRGLVDDFVREEIYYREALAMGLDRDDSIVRRRMRQKLEFLASDLGSVSEPSDDELGRWLEAHAEDYRIPPRSAFRQVYVSRDHRGEPAEAAARALLGQLQANADASRLGDPTLLPAALPLSSEQEIARSFGEEFAAATMQLEPGRWSGPIASVYGLHLVRIEAREAGRMPALAEVRDAVRNDWLAARSATADEAFFQALRARYEVTIEGLPEAAPADAGGPTP